MSFKIISTSFQDFAGHIDLNFDLLKRTKEKKMNVKVLLTSVMVSTIFGCYSVFAQVQPSPQMAEANSLFTAQRWQEAASAYERILKGEPGNGRAWYQLGMVRYSLKQYPQAAEAFEKNILISDNPFAMYNLACVYSLLKENEKAIEWLTKTVSHPKFVLGAINFDDPDLAGVKNDSRVKAMAEQADRQAHPCKYSPEAKQFDFFLGEWDAFNPQGNKAGISVIQSIAGGCGILENWTEGFGGGGGKSINFYDKDAGKWFQYWIGSNGRPRRFSGVYKDGAIRYEGETAIANGKRIISRLTFFSVDADTVRQLAENSDDEGKTWSVVYDFRYVRKK